MCGHRRSLLDVTHSRICPLRSGSVWLGSTKDHVVAVEKAVRIRDASQRALRKSTLIRVSNMERVNIRNAGDFSLSTWCLQRVTMTEKHVMKIEIVKISVC